MSPADHDPVTWLRACVLEATATVRGGAGEPSAPPALERPRRSGQGHFATNAALLLAPVLGAPPREIAERLKDELHARLGARLERSEVAGPGFVNLWMSASWQREALAQVLEAGASLGAGGAHAPERILLEFVSANPTAELVAASGRHAAYGDSLARILAHHGHEVSREYYFNDAGSQIRRLGESVRARALGEPVPEDGYQGEYVAQLARMLVPDRDHARQADVDQLAAGAVQVLLARIKRTLERYGVRFDTYFSERTLHEGSPSPLERAITSLSQAGHTFRADGALFLRTTAFGDEKDRVLVRSTGEPTYFAADLAYMEDKLGRGFDRQLLVVGADHHGYIARLKAAFAGLGHDPERLEVLILQFVHLVEGTSRTAMSKRRGEFVTLDELLDEIGVDATRWFMIQSSHDRTLDLNLDLARTESSENPVYYVQYAHARAVSMLQRAGEERVHAAVNDGPGAWARSGAVHPAESELLFQLLMLPSEIAEAAERRAPHRIAAYALALAQVFTTFYRDCKVLGSEPRELESARLAICLAASGVLELVLGLLGVSAPDSM